MDLDDLSFMPQHARANLDVLLVFNVLRTHNYFSPRLDRGLSELRLTSSQLNVLLVLHAAEPRGLTLSEIGRNLVVSKANITGLMDRMEQRGFVCREGTDDRRVSIAKLTDAGRKLALSIFPGTNDLFAEMVGFLAFEEKRALIGLLTKLRQGIREKEQSPPTPLPRNSP